MTSHTREHAPSVEEQQLEETAAISQSRRVTFNRSETLAILEGRGPIRPQRHSPIPWLEGQQRAADPPSWMGDAGIEETARKRPPGIHVLR